MADHLPIPTAEDEPQVEAARVKVRLTPTQWVRKRLFNNTRNTIITLVLVPLTLWGAYRFAMFLFFNARWEPVTTNLLLFMVGRFPREEMWRVIAQIIIWSSAIGLAWGAAVAGARARALRAGLDFTPDPALVKARRYWALLGVVALLLAMTQSIGPLLLFLLSIGLAIGIQWVASRTGAADVGYLWWGVAILGVAGFQIVSGFHGNGWVWMGLPFAMIAARIIRRLREWASLRALRLTQIGVGVVVLGATYAAYAAFGSVGIGWERWEGLRLNLMAAPIAIAFAFPLGVGLALLRRSSFPTFRFISTGYIELIRGVPLISLLLVGQYFISFFLNTTAPLSLMTRSFIVLSMFSGAYIAEIVRGGLQSVPRGQIEAGQSIGLSPWQVTRRIVLPQALRNVIPAMVGHFISLTKDTTLLYVISVAELLYVRGLVHAQPAFRGFGIAETAVFVALIFWAVTFTMSRESQRLERKLGVGER